MTRLEQLAALVGHRERCEACDPGTFCEAALVILAADQNQPRKCSGNPRRAHRDAG